MDDTKKEHQYSMESQGYDDLTEKLQESLDKQLKSLSGSLDEQSKLISKFLKQVGDSYSDVFKKINDTAINSGLINGLSELYHSEYNSSANGKTPDFCMFCFVCLYDKFVYEKRAEVKLLLLFNEIILFFRIPFMSTFLTYVHCF